MTLNIITQSYLLRLRRTWPRCTVLGYVRFSEVKRYVNLNEFRLA